MIRLLSIITLILALVFFPPAVLALVSNNAVPGDATYPIKRSLEDIILAVASINPVTRAWFTAARSDRRFKEVTVLFTQGKKATNTLNELVVQTDIAASEIKKVDDPTKKQELISQLSESITKYDQGLEEASKQLSERVSIQTSTVINQPTPSPQPVVTIKPTPLPIVSTPKPTPTPKPSVVHRPNPTPQASPTIPTIKQAPEEQKQLEEAREKLEEIKKKLEEEKEEIKMERGEKKDKEEKDHRKDRKDKDDEARDKNKP